MSATASSIAHEPTTVDIQSAPISPITLRKDLDRAIFELSALAGSNQSELIKAKLRRAYKHLRLELQQIDTDVLLALEQEVA
jgi:hypothetical protein